VDSHLEVIDAFVDGERVDAADFKRALADPDGRDYFVDLWMLREAVQQDREAAAVDRHVAPRRVGSRAAGRWIIAASIVTATAGGFLAGHRMSPPAPAPAPPATVAETPAPAEFPAPAPTRVIQLEFQLDHPRSGGD
jgi:hypothetical protein